MKQFFRLLSWTAEHGLINLIHWLTNRKMFDVQVSEEFRVGNSSITDSEIHASYPSLCGSAAKNLKILRNFAQQESWLKL